MVDQVTTPQYKYIFTRTVSTAPIGEMVDELPGMYGVSMSKFKNRPGNLTASIRLDSPSRTPAEILEATRPQERSIWVYRNNRVVWAGIVWSRTYQSDSKTISLTAQTHDSWLHHNIFDNLAWAPVQHPAKLIIDTWNIARNSSFSSAYADPPGEWIMQGYPDPVHGSNLALKADANSGTKISSFIDSCVKAGAEYRVLTLGDSGFTPTGRINFLQVGQSSDSVSFPGVAFNVGKSAAASDLVFQYPGAIKKFWWPESAGQGADVGKMLLARSKSLDGVSTVIKGPSQSGDPRNLEKVTTGAYFGIENAANSAASSMMFAIGAQERRTPAVRPTFELDIGHPEVDIDDIDVGDYFKYVLNDPLRFPTPRIGTARIDGWSLTPPQGDNPESFGITLDDRLSTALSGSD